MSRLIQGKQRVRPAFCCYTLWPTCAYPKRMWPTAHVALSHTDLGDMIAVNQLKLFTMTEKNKSQTKLSKTDQNAQMRVSETQSEASKVHLSRDDFLGHRVHAQGARVTGLHTPALQDNQQPPSFTQATRQQNTCAQITTVRLSDCQSLRAKKGKKSD